jgi:hypothetical protein
MKKLILICAAMCAFNVADARERHRDRDREIVCKEPIRAAGDAYHLLRSAKASAVKRWQEQVINAHGERYINFENARVVSNHCDPARVGGGNTILDLKRCVIVARPCLQQSDD